MAATPNVVWLTLDSVRVDHTTMGGDGRDTTPHLQRLSGDLDGRWDSRCFPHSNSTRISTVQPEKARAMVESLDAWMAEFGQPDFDADDEAESSDAMKAQFTGLGYLVE